MKKLFALFGVCMMIFLLAACGSKKMTESERYEYYKGKYSKILEKYYDALSEEWDAEKLQKEDMSILYSYCYEGEPLENIGYSLMDVNGDGAYELLIGAMTDDVFSNKMIFDLYTLKGKTPVKVFSGQERDCYYICKEEVGGNIVANEASAGAENSAWFFSILEREELTLMQAVLYDAAANPANPWYMSYDRDWDVSNDNPVEEKVAKSIISSYEKKYILPDYVSFSSYD